MKDLLDVFMDREERWTIIVDCTLYFMSLMLHEDSVPKIAIEKSHEYRFAKARI